ncbi:MAG: hypothetical protein HOI23_18730 [Deltaproteobacteria bacterium]|jgi:hypothetical protein|nr:hypothetical protein [Deltaproteobacteria bacterium]MBT6435829.1 hypothetical protein [Deltaproteobacteria bacterium]
MLKLIVLITYLATPTAEPVAEPALVPETQAPTKGEPKEALKPLPDLDAVNDAEQKFIFYNPDGIGAHAFHTPWAIIIESGLEEYDARPLSKLNLLNGQKKVLQAFGDPAGTIKSYGAKNFLYQQILPLNTLTGGPPAFIPNYLWHFLGGGFRHRMMTEYYTHKGAEYPQLYSWLTLYAGHWLNEAVQAQKFKTGSADALADLLFFDWIGKVMFLSDDVSRFFADTLHFRDWTFQTSYNPLTNSLYNTGQLMWARVDVWGGVSISGLSGHLINALGLTYSHNDNQTQWSSGWGLQARRFKLLPNGDLAPGKMRWCIFGAYSENDNPLVVVVAKQGFDDVNTLYDEKAPEPNTLQNNNFVLAASLQVNIYPKWLEVWGQKLAVHVSWMQGTVFMGIGHNLLPLGMSLSPQLAEKYRDDF